MIKSDVVHLENYCEGACWAQLKPLGFSEGSKG